MECSSPASSLHGILQARILEWVGMPFPRGYSQPRDQTHISYSSCISVRFLTAEPLEKPRKRVMLEFKPEMLREVSILPLQLFRKGRGTRDQVANICWIIENTESSRKTSISPLLTMPKPLTVCITINSGKFWKRWEYQTTWPAPWETCMQVRKQQLELDIEQQTGSK